MPSKIAGGENLPDDVFRSQKGANPRVIVSLAGRARQRYERATGHNPVSGESPATALNPQGKLGHDHCGPPWGAAFLRPVAWLIGRDPDSASIQSGYFEARSGIAGSTAAAVGPWLMWQQPFSQLPSPSIAPYARLYLYVRALTNAGTSDLTVVLKSRELFTQAPTTRTSNVGTITTTETGFANADAFVTMVPGYNHIDLSFAGSHDSNEITIVCAALCQIVKLTH